MDHKNSIDAGLSGSKPKGKAKLHEINMRRGHQGGYIAKHNYRHDNGEPGHPHGQEPEYPLADHAAMLKHMQEHMPEEAAEKDPSVQAADRE